MKIIYNAFIPFKGYSAINIFGIIFARQSKKGKLSERAIRHERIHTAQMIEMGYILFYIWYAVEFLIKYAKIKRWKQAYYAVSFEQEAYYNQDFEDYEYQRKKYAWTFYL